MAILYVAGGDAGAAPIILAGLWVSSCSKSVPPVPALNVDGLDSDVRTAILKSREQAVAQPKSAHTSGSLGMVLEAHALYQPAALAYQRAVRLDPKDFRWRYYLALSLEKTGRVDEALSSIS